ncbi:MAG: methylglyoxal synthase [Chloroflexi bacterium]|nr:methylglyoxal synthase [Chloroflexota bacterium]
MVFQTAKMPAQKRIALIAHDDRKLDLLEWAQYNRDELSQHILYATGTTGTILSKRLGLEVTTFMSGPMGGDQQIGSRIAEGEIDVLIFFWDPLESHPHDPDVRALLRVAVMQNIPIACNRSSADFIFSSLLMDQPYERHLYDYVTRLKRERVIEQVRFTDETH